LVTLGALAPRAAAEVRIIRRAAIVPQMGVTCGEIRDPTSCLFSPRFAIDFIGGELHVGGLLGHTPPAGVIGGFQVGLDLGTPYFILVHGRTGHALALAVRASLDHDLVAESGHVAFYQFTNTYGPNLSIGLGTWRVSLVTRIAVGLSVVAPLNTDLTVNNQRCCTVGPALDAYVGFQIWL
jgi:hypothetical protein